MSVSKSIVFAFFQSEMNNDASHYLDCGEVNSTLLAENAQDHFKVATDEGRTPVEEEIFDWAVEFSIGWEKAN